MRLKLQRFLMRTVEISHKQWTTHKFIIEIIILLVLCYYQPDQWQLKAFTKLTDQWSESPIVGLQIIDALDKCPDGDSQNEVKIPFYGTKQFCHNYYNYDISLGSCDESETTDTQGKKTKSKDGEDSIVIYETTYTSFGGKKLCISRDPLNRNYYSLIETPQYRSGLAYYNSYQPEYTKLSNDLHYDEQSSTFRFSDEGYQEPIVALRIDLTPYPCLIPHEERSDENIRDISKIFKQPKSCYEKTFIDEHNKRHRLYQKVEGFEINEYQVLEEHKVFQRLDNDNPYNKDIKKIYDRDLFKNQFYSLYQQGYLKYSYHCNLEETFSINKFIRMLKDFKYIEQLISSMLLIVLIVDCFNAILDFKEILHEKLVKIVSLGFIVFSYSVILYLYIRCDKSYQLIQFQEKHCLEEDFANNALTDIIQNSKYAEQFLFRYIFAFILIKLAIDVKINFSR